MKTAFKACLFGSVLIGIFYLGTTLTTANLPKEGVPSILYANQVRDDLRLTFTTAIRQAEKSVLLMIYSLRDPHIIQALRKKGEEGLEVTVICDAKASSKVGPLLGPKVRTVQRFSNGLMHQKILVVDGKSTWIGSANMTQGSLRMYGNLVAGMYSKELATNVLQKAETLSQEGLCRPFPHQSFWIGGQATELWFLPDNEEAVERIITLLESAEKTIRVAMFTWTRTDFAEKIAAAKNRGVKVEVVIDSCSGHGASSKVVNLLKERGVPVFLSQGSPLLHHKFLEVDNRFLAVGSANWTQAAFTQNDDCFLILHELTENQRNKLNSLWQVLRSESR